MTGRRKARHRRRRHPADPPVSSVGDGTEETAEFETVTNDPVVDVTPAGSVHELGQPRRDAAV